jgi:multisubunit Na+/H+ antiporter MnhG subunit
MNFILMALTSLYTPFFLRPLSSTSVRLPHSYALKHEKAKIGGLGSISYGVGVVITMPIDVDVYVDVVVVVAVVDVVFLPEIPMQT